MKQQNNVKNTTADYRYENISQLHHRRHFVSHKNIEKLQRKIRKAHKLYIMSNCVQSKQTQHNQPVQYFNEC